MARKPRVIVPGQPVHVILRGNNRQSVFYTESDYRKYKEILTEYAEEYECAIHAYILMTNHIHLLVTPADKDGLPKLMQAMGRKYVRHINILYKRSGTLWEGRYKSALIDSENYFMTCSRYIELNPVRAGMVSSPEQYKWSSFHSNALGFNDEIIIPHNQYMRLGRTNVERQKAYRALFTTDLDHQNLKMLRDSTNQCALVGDNGFRSSPFVCRIQISTPAEGF